MAIPSSVFHVSWRNFHSVSFCGFYQKVRMIDWLIDSVLMFIVKLAWLRMSKSFNCINVAISAFFWSHWHFNTALWRMQSKCGPIWHAVPGKVARRKGFMLIDYKRQKVSQPKHISRQRNKSLRLLSTPRLSTASLTGFSLPLRRAQK